jgi:hypothetical protein
MDAALWGIPAAACTAWLVAVICIVRHFDKAPASTAPSQPTPHAWIDDRIRSERDPARRTAWRMIRDDDLENL